MRPVADAGSIDAGAIGHSGAFTQGFAAGALLAMVADILLPEAYETSRASPAPWSPWALRSR
jgi:zinc transporter ZupT